MKCCTRYTVGVIIGSLYLLAAIILFVLMSVFLLALKIGENKQNFVKPEAIPTIATILVISLLIALICVFLILGILKKRHNFMLPWLITYVLGFGFSCLIFFYGFIGAALGNAEKYEFVMLLLITVIAIVLQIVVFFFMCILYRSIRRDNLQRSLPQRYQTPACYYTAVYNK